MAVQTHREEVEFFGHPMVRSAHRNTIEVTKAADLTARGDCIIGVRADKGPADLARVVRECIMDDRSEVLLTIQVEPEEFLVRAVGSSGLSLTDAHEMVVRRSEFVSARTLAIRADAAAKDIPRRMVEALRDPARRGLLRIEVRLR